MKLGNKERFLILKNIKSFILNLEPLLITFPKKDIISRNKMYDAAIDLLECVIKANHETNNTQKKTYQIEAIAKISKIDFLLERAYKLRYISSKQCEAKSAELAQIYRMIVAWYTNE